jgi:hypothetical protein
MKVLLSTETSVNTPRYIAGGVRDSSLWITDLMELPVISESQQAATTCRTLLLDAVQMYMCSGNSLEADINHNYI